MEAYFWLVASSAICVTLILLIQLPRHNSDAGTELLQSGAEALQVTSG